MAELQAGQKIGAFELLGAVGAGGMGQVFRARDTRLGREVAIKVIPEHLSGSPETLERFRREAQTVAMLSHPHICVLYDVGEHEGMHYLVMELLEGEPLSARVNRGPLPTADLLRYGVQIADGLERAHQSGVVHRDIKPANIFITKSGAKLLDFGLAKPNAQVISSTAMTAMTQTSLGAAPVTAAGTIVGTFQYMAPEQLEGKEADPRSDVFAFGAVLYEMATGRPAFSGKSSASLIANILASEPPPISSIAPASPFALDRIIRNCLAKDPDDRYQSAHDLKLHLSSLLEAGSQLEVPAIGTQRRFKFWPVVGALTAAAVLFAALGWAGGRMFAPKPEVIRSFLAPPTGYAAISDLTIPSISPEGRRVIFNAYQGDTGKVFLFDLVSGERRELPFPGDVVYYAWSPDGTKIVYSNTSQPIRIFDISSGSSVQLTAVQDGVRGLTWGADGTIVYGTRRGGLMAVNSATGEQRELTKLGQAPRENDVSHRFPQFLPDGKHLIFTATPTGATDENNAVVVLDVRSGEMRQIAIVNSHGIYAEPYMLFHRGSVLIAQRFDLRTLELKGESQVLVGGTSAVADTGYTSAAAAKDVLVYAESPAEQRQGKLITVAGSKRDTVVEGLLREPSLSTDGKLLLYTQGEASSATVWIQDLARGSKTQLTRGHTDLAPILSPDRQWVYFSRFEKGWQQLMRVRADDSGVEQHIDTKTYCYPAEFSRDGSKLVVVIVNRVLGRRSIGIMDLAHGNEVTPFIPDSTYAHQDPALSPDGKHLAYITRQNNVWHVYMRDFPGAQNQVLISDAGAVSPKWSADGKHLYFLRGSNNEDSIYRVSINTQGGAVRVGDPELVVSLPKMLGTLPYAVFPDGKLIVALRGDATYTSIGLIQNWQQLLKQ